MTPDGWTCPYCQRLATLSEPNVTSASHNFYNSNKDGMLQMAFKAITCPNRNCREYSLSSQLFKLKERPTGVGWEQGDLLFSWQLRPQSSAKPYPDFIPKALLEDYAEACAICDLSPKASATLSRRCLQGMIRDFWNVSKPNLFQEIEAIKEKVDVEIWQAIDAVRKIGNIGAHMEKDINLVIDVEPHEAQMLIGLIEVLLDEWYIARKKRADQLKGVIALAGAKKA